MKERLKPGPKGDHGYFKRRVIEQIIRGLSNKEIADVLEVSERAVKWHVARIMHERGLYGSADARRLVVTLMKEQIAYRMWLDRSVEEVIQN
jgi:hypothetical protein